MDYTFWNQPSCRLCQTRKRMAWTGALPQTFAGSLSSGLQDRHLLHSHPRGLVPSGDSHEGLRTGWVSRGVSVDQVSRLKKYPVNGVIMPGGMCRPVVTDRANRIENERVVVKLP